MKSQAIVHGGEAVGALIPDGEQFRFVAVKFSVWALDGLLYENTLAAQIAVRAHFAGERTSEPAFAGMLDEKGFPTAEGYHAFPAIVAAVGE